MNPDRKTEHLLTLAETLIDKPVPRYVCPFCDATRHSRPGLAAHMVAYHPQSIEVLVTARQEGPK